MTSKNKIYSRYRTKWLIPLRKYENILIKGLLRIFKNEYTDYADYYDNITQEGGIGILKKMQIKANINDVLTGVIKKIIPFSGEMVYRDINCELKSDFNYEAYISKARFSLA